MFLANVPGDSQAPLGAACDDHVTAPRPMPLLTELDRDSVGWSFYKRGAPNGAFALAAFELIRFQRLPKAVNKLLKQFSSRERVFSPG